MFKNTKIVTKVIIGLCGVFLLATFAAAFALLNIETIARNTQLFYTQPYLQIDNVGQVRANLLQEKMNLYQSIASGDAEEKDDADVISGATKTLDYSLRELKGSFADGAHAQYIEQIDQAEHNIIDAHAVMGKIRKAIEGGRSKEAARLYSEEYLPAIGKAEAIMTDIHTQANSEAQRFAADAESVKNRTFLLILIIMIGGLITSVGVCFAIYKSIKTPMRAIMADMHRVAKGDLNIKSEYHDRNEFGELASEIDLIADDLRRLVSEAKALTDASSAGNFSLRADADAFEGSYREILDGVNATLETVVDKTHWFEGILDSIPFPVSAMDMDMNFTFLNKPAEAAVGKPREQAIGQPCAQWNCANCGTEKCAVAMLRDHGEPNTSFSHGGKEYSVLTTRLNGRNGDQNGYIELIRDATKEIRRNIYQQAEVGRLAHNLEQLAQGNLSFDVSVAAADQYTQAERALFERINGSLANARDNLALYIGEISAVLLQIAEGNLCVEAEGNYKGDFTQIKSSMNRIIASLNDTLSQINRASSEVLGGAEQVASGAQSLSQGATEQAGAIEELSATVEDISSQIAQNAQSAKAMEQTSSVAAASIEQEGHKISDMVVAMERIRESSQQIGKIIKTIDEIAFQTNILALNAAVEAARAGEAGKGFAVVADEVRNLASKSAEAAKNTAALIENSLRAIEQGVAIADETGKSLVQMVDSVHQNALDSKEIAQASARQAVEIEQLTKAVRQISLVVQSNSSTAEQSAAASEELSGQAGMLHTLVRNFTLRQAGIV